MHTLERVLAYGNEDSFEHVQAFGGNVACVLASTQSLSNLKSAMVSLSTYSVDDVGDFLLERGIPGDVVTCFTGKRTTSGTRLAIIFKHLTFF